MITLCLFNITNAFVVLLVDKSKRVTGSKVIEQFCWLSVAFSPSRQNGGSVSRRLIGLGFRYTSPSFARVQCVFTKHFVWRFARGKQNVYELFLLSFRLSPCTSIYRLYNTKILSKWSHNLWNNFLHGKCQFLVGLNSKTELRLRACPSFISYYD